MTRTSKVLTIHKANAALVTFGMVGAVLPALAMQILSAILLIFGSPLQWLAYAFGWWGLISLLRVFSSFYYQDVEIGPVTVLGLVVASVTVTMLLWPVITRTPACSTCKPPEFFAYRPHLLCVAVSAHWWLLHFTGFRLSLPIDEAASVCREP